MESHSPNSTTRSLGLRKPRAHSSATSRSMSKLSGATVRMKKGTCCTAEMPCLASRRLSSVPRMLLSRARNASAMQSSSSPGLAGGQADSLASLRSCSADAVDSALTRRRLASVCQFRWKFRRAPAALRFSASFCRSPRSSSKAATSASDPLGPRIRNRTPSPPGLTSASSMASVLSQRRPTVGVVDPQHGDVPALVARAPRA